MKIEIEKMIAFVTSSVKWLEQEQEGCCEFKLDNDLSLFVGWQDGYDETEKKTSCIVAGIKSNHEYLKTDYDWLVYPYSEKTGDVWDTDITIDATSKTIDKETATYFIKEYKSIRKLLDNKELRI